MSLRRKKLLLRVLALMLLLGGALIAVWGYRGDCSIPVTASAISGRPSRPAANDNHDALPELKEFEAHWNKPLRRPLFDPPPVVVPPPKKEPPPPLNVRLVGTIIEPGKTIAMLTNARNALEFKQVGETVGSGKLLATITAIENSRVVVQYAGETLVLTMQDGGRR